MDSVGNTASFTKKGLASVAWGVGRFVGIIVRALRIRRWPPRLGRREPSERHDLLLVIARLEEELDQVYYQMARGDEGLSGLLSRQRGLKEELRRARARLKRLDRDAAMDRRLLRILFSGPSSPDGEKSTPPMEQHEFEDEEGEYEFESLLDEDL